MYEEVSFLMKRRHYHGPIKEVDVFTWLPGTVGLLGHDTVPFCIPTVSATNQDLWSHNMPDHRP